MRIRIGQFRFFRLISIFIIINSILYILLEIKKDKPFSMDTFFGVLIIVFGVVISIYLFLLSFWVYIIDERGITVESQLTKSKRYYSWTEFNYAYYNVNYRGDTTLIVSPRQLTYTEKKRILHRIYWDPVQLENIFRLRFDSNSEAGKSITKFVREKYGVSLIKFHRV